MKSSKVLNVVLAVSVLAVLCTAVSAQEPVPQLMVAVKNVETFKGLAYEWMIDKTGDQTEIVLSPGQQYQMNYTVVVDVVSATESGWSVEGQVRIYNPTALSATITGVSVVMNPGAISAAVTCGVSLPYVLTAGSFLWCSFEAAVPDDTTLTISATVTTTGDVVGASGFETADFSSVTLTGEIDECIDVTDSLAGFLGTVCAGAAPATFQYTWMIGPYSYPEDCGENCVPNTASFVTNDTATTGDDSWTVCALVPCDDGCTLTPGYWKTHSEYGPAPYDDTWAMLASGADTPFFLSGQSYYEVLWTPPKGGNAYYILAHAYIAAELNVLNGTSIPGDVGDAWDEATVLFGTYTPAEVAALKGRSGREMRQMWIDLAGLLDDYNNGLVGPGHCDDDGALMFKAKSDGLEDVNNDGITDAVDVQLVINAALGL